MHCLERDGLHKIHPKDKSNFLSHFLFWWQTRIFCQNSNNHLPEDDFKNPPKELESAFITNTFENFWQKEKSHKKPSLFRALIRAFGGEFIKYGILYLFIDNFCGLSQPFFVIRFLNYFSADKPTTIKKQAFGYGFGIVACGLVRAFMFHFYYLQLTTLGIKIRLACSSLIYRKIFSLKLKKNRKITLAQIINLLSNDAERFNMCLVFINALWTNIIKIIIIIYIISTYFDFYALIGIVMLTLMLIFQLYFFRKMVRLKLTTASKTDDRIHLMEDIISGIRTIKMHSWEKLFAGAVDEARKIELHHMKTVNLIKTLSETVLSYSHRLAVFSYLVIVVSLGLSLIPEYLYALITIYETLGTQTFIFIAVGAKNLFEFKTSILRIQNFLLSDFDYNAKTSQGCVSLEQVKPNGRQCEIIIKDASTKWDSSTPDYILNDLNLNVSFGDLVGIIGVTGSGKSTLLQLILEEVDVMKGSLEVKGTISYAPQEPWIFSGTIRQNIIFGEDIDEKRYSKILNMCALNYDLSKFQHGDQTLVGERGVMVSGGQKARIGLARALYRNADIYLLDNPLAAVDTKVADQIFNDSFLNYLKEKCVIFITHQTRHLKNLNRVYILENGKLINFKAEDDVDINSCPPFEDITEYKEDDVEIEQKEDSNTDMRNTYRLFFSSGNKLIVTVSLFVFYIFVQFLINLSDVFMTLWADLQQSSSEYVSDIYYFPIYGVLILLIIFLQHIAAFWLIHYCTNISKYLHDMLFTRILSASLTFFNNHSSGRIHNRISKDMGMIDEYIPNALLTVIINILQVGGASVVIIITNYWMLFPTMILLLIFYFHRKICIPSINYFKIMASTREWSKIHKEKISLIRIISTGRSPILTQTSATVKGLVLIKTSNKAKDLQKEFDNFQNYHTSVFYLYKALYCGYGFVIDIMGVVYTWIMIYGALLVMEDAHIGNVGLAITQSLVLIGNLEYVMRTFGDLDSEMTSVHRVTEYKDLIVEEDKGIFDPPELWPRQGEIIFDSVYLKYSQDSDHVLKNISLIIHPKEKVGIVGRTGSGKTSLISLLFRLYDFKGKITVDGVDIKSIPLALLRSKMSIISQDAVVFSGTLRKNLDPFGEFSDSQLWQALEEVDLKKFVASLPSGLMTLLSDNGSNLSVGQKHLLCLARAVLENTKIIVLDEATANVDLETDRVIQSTIRKKFNDCTVLSVAHRINTVLDSDKILVMDSGVIVEFEETETLLQNKNSYFSKLAEKI